ncbi:transcription factor tfiiib component [Moelleriella libera RCEF 2490]|uniref:Transcription factor tfiiib component n=1 Tax=Moelleriella libera RCEF 2490 TaxID=1081109 RepID=A0A166V0U1_9HYPO|nr:transcription factor tfiiib component [Moelleriella libera RCEF 2490]
MSSMFKKKGGLAFKPKAPTARSRPAGAHAKPTPPPPPPPPPPPAPPSSKPSSEPVTISNDQTDHSDGQVTIRGSHQETSVDTGSSRGQEEELPVAPRRTTRRASQTRQAETSSVPEDVAEPGQATVESSAEVEPPPPTPPSRPRTRRQSAAAKAPPKLSIETISEEATQPEDAATAADDSQPDHTTSSVPTAALAEEPNVPLRAPKPTPRRADAGTTATTEAATTGIAEEQASKPKKRKRGTAAASGNNSARALAPKKRTASTPNIGRSRSSSRRARSATPPGAESQVVDLQKLKMSDLTKDLRIGKKFSRHDELRERERKARLKAKLEKDGGSETLSAEAETPSSVEAKSGTPQQPSEPQPQTAPAATTGPQFRIVDGQIVVDQNSLVMDRHARAAAAQANSNMETIEENDFTRLITSSSFMNTSKLKGPNIWTPPETELFYRALRMFGTDFQMISGMFPSKQRRHVKLKFNREERLNPALVSAAVTGEKTIKMDIDEYRALTGAEFESVETIEAEQRKIQERYEAERQRIADEQAEIMRKKREELFADDQPDDGGSKKGGRRKGKRKGKQAVTYGMNGQPIAAAVTE